MGNSFDEAIEQEPRRFIGYAFEENPNISDFREFSQALEDGIKVPKGEISEQTKINLFESPETKDRIRNSLRSTSENEKEADRKFDQLYGDGVLVKRQVVRKRVITITRPKIRSSGYVTKRTSKPVPSYSRGKPLKFSPAEARFLRIRKIKKLTPKQVINEYNTHFKGRERTESSIKSKFYRS